MLSTQVKWTENHYRYRRPKHTNYYSLSNGVWIKLCTLGTEDEDCALGTFMRLIGSKISAISINNTNNILGSQFNMLEINIF